MNQDETTTALTVRLGEIAFPEGVETLGEKANYLHRCSVEYSKKSAGAAILAGWVLTVARSTCAHGQPPQIPAKGQDGRTRLSDDPMTSRMRPRA